MLKKKKKRKKEVHIDEVWVTDAESALKTAAYEKPDKHAPATRRL